MNGYSTLLHNIAPGKYIVIKVEYGLQSLRKFPRLYRTAGLVDWKNLPDQPQFHQTDTILEQTTKKEKKNKFLSLNVI